MEWPFMKEIGRKVIHLTILIALVIYLAVERTYGKQPALLTLTGILIFFLILEYLRLDWNVQIPYFSQFIRPKEQHRMYGVIFFLSGVIISLAVYDIRIAFAAILMATFGDLAASLLGTKYGNTRLFRNKTAVGFSAGFVTNLIVGFFILVPYFNILVFVSMALTASLVETYTDEIDDNFLVPIIAGFVGQMLISVL